MTEELTEDDINARANEKARKRKAAREKILATKTKETWTTIMAHEITLVNQTEAVSKANRKPDKAKKSVGTF